jgi:hypothetical protein
MRTPRPHTAREEARVEIRQRPDARPAPETSAAGAATMRVVGAAAIALAASLVIENVVVLAGAPGYGAPIKEVLAYHAEHRAARPVLPTATSQHSTRTSQHSTRLQRRDPAIAAGQPNDQS